MHQDHSPLRTGFALAITVGVFYALCALVWALAPGPFLGFMNNLFHGMDFSSILLSEQRAHFLGALPWLLLLACTLMHVFMHRGHGGHGGCQAVGIG